MQTSPRKKKYVLLTLFFGIVILSGFYFLKVRGGYETESPRRGPIIESVYGLGTVVALQSHQIKTAVNQVIVDIYVQEGSEVRSGTPVMKLGESGVQRAPFDSTVTSIPFKRGEVLFPSVPAMTLVSLKHLVLEVSLEQQSVMRVKSGQPVMVSFESLRGEKIHSKVESVFPREGQFLVRIPLEPVPPGVLPGMTADVGIEVGRKDQALTIPIRAVSAGGVTVIRHGKKVRIPVKIGVMDGEWAEVIGDGVQESDQILMRRH